MRLPDLPPWLPGFIVWAFIVGGGIALLLGEGQ